jgi:hypothetical protein
MSDWSEQVFELIRKTREVRGYREQGKSKAAAVTKAPCDMIVSNNPDRILTNSKAASTLTPTTQYQTVITNMTWVGVLLEKRFMSVVLTILRLKI